MARVCLFVLASFLLIGSFVSADDGDATNTDAAADSPAEVEETPQSVEVAAEAPKTEEAAPADDAAAETEPAEETDKQEETNAENNVQTLDEELKEPPNEWGTYYSLPSEMPDMLDLFNEAFENYIDSENSETQCRENDAGFNRWYKSYENADHVLLSYYCKGSAVRGYEHLKVSLSKRNVIQFGDSLKIFGITDAGDYDVKLGKKEAEEIRDELLPMLIDQIAEQKADTAAQEEICPNPGTETYASASEKYENGLYYDKIKISCNKTATESGLASHMTDIEVVTDRDFKKLNEGKPVLVSMETNVVSNNMFIEKVESDDTSLKQVDDAPTFVPTMTSFVSLVIMLVLPRLF